MRVLVVSDEPDAAELLSRILGRVRYEVERARDFTGLADRLADPPRLDCIVLDVSARGIGGNLQLLDAVRSFREPAIARTPVVLIAGTASSAMFSWQAGVDELLVRPFHADELATAVAAAIARPDDERPRHRRYLLDVAKSGGRR